MTNCKINFTKETDPLAYGLYQDFLKTGVSCDDFDHGYNVTNYAGLYCPEKDARSCVIGKGDRVVEADEVKEYALDKEYELDPQKYEQYRRITEGRLGEPLPWVLDDLDPKTTDDGEIRRPVQAAINELKRTILAQGIAENSEKYNEMMAAGLTWFVATPPMDEAEGKIVWKDRYIQGIIDGIKKDGLEGFWEYLEENGGIRIEGDYLKEYTALEALGNKEGACTEISKILFAAMKMAGLQPVFIYEDMLKEETNDPIMKEVVEGSSRTDFHVCIGLYIGKRIRLFDSMLVNSNAGYGLYTPLSLRQYLGLDYSNRGEYHRQRKGELDEAIADHTRAIEIDPKCVPAYTNRGNALKDKGKLDEAIADYTRAIEINPKLAPAYYKRGNAWKAKNALDNAIADYTMVIEIDPKYVHAYNNRGNAWAGKSKLDIAIADFTRAIEIDPKLAEAYNNRGVALKNRGELDKAIADLAMAAALDRVSYYNKLLTVAKEKWQSTEELKNSASIFWDETGGADISAYEAQFALSYALWEFKKYEDAKEGFGLVLKSLDFKKKPSKSTTDFFKDMLALMPAPMKIDKDVQKILKSLQEKTK